MVGIIINGGRIYDRIHYCLYCGKSQPKIGRHLQIVHSKEQEVKNLEEMDKISKETNLDLLRYKGDFYHNIKVLKIGGELIVWRRPAPNDIVTFKSYVPCVHCLVFVTKDEMWRHLKTCKNKGNENNNNIIAQCDMLLYSNKYSTGASKELIPLVLDKMNKDDLYNCVRNDKLITTYGSFLLGVTAGFKKVNSISQRMRVLARLVLKMRKGKDDNLSLSDIIKPEHFDAIVDATKELAGFEMVNNEGEFVPVFKTPSLPLLVGYVIEKCASLMHGIGIKSRDSSSCQDAKNFLKLYKLEWSAKISSICLKNMDTNKFNKLQLLPITEDLLKIRGYMKDNIPAFTKSLHENPKIETWRKLAELTGSRLTIFNRRRGNEVFNLLVTRFKEKDKFRTSEIEEIKDSLTALEKRLMQR